MAFDHALYRAHIHADDIGKSLLMAHARKEYCQDGSYSSHIRDAEKKFADLARYFGYRLEKIEAPANEAAA